MSFIYNTKYFDGTTLLQLSPKQSAIRTFLTSDGIVVAMFQGNRGAHPHLDFKVKILKPGPDEKPFPPPHTFWVVDLLMKVGPYPNEVREIVEYYRTFYDEVEPFSSVQERAAYHLVTLRDIVPKYAAIDDPRTLSLDYVATVIELFCICEKRNPGAYMFRTLLETLIRYCKGESDYIEVMQAAQPGFRK